MAVRTRVPDGPAAPAAAVRQVPAARVVRPL